METSQFKFFAKLPKKLFFTLTYRCFLTSAKRINAQTGRRKHFCQISRDQANTELTWRRLSSLSRNVQQQNGSSIWDVSTDEEIKIILISSMTKLSINISNPNPDVILPSYSLSGQLFVLFQVCSFHFFYILLQSCHGVLPLTPSTDKTNPVNLPQPLDGNIFNIHFFFLAVCLLLIGWLDPISSSLDS